jgi:hypothetical protein
VGDPSLTRGWVGGGGGRGAGKWWTPLAGHMAICARRAVGVTGMVADRYEVVGDDFGNTESREYDRWIDIRVWEMGREVGMMIWEDSYPVSGQLMDSRQGEEYIRAP